MATHYELEGPGIEFRWWQYFLSRPVSKSSQSSVERVLILISLFHRAFQFTMFNRPINAIVCNKTLIQMSYIKTLKITPTCLNHQLIIIRELYDPG
jgi:hypothetical protein